MLEPSHRSLDWPAFTNNAEGCSIVFQALREKLEGHACVTHRPRGVAFLTAAQELYGLLDIGYACINLPIRQGNCRHSHCIYTSACMGQWVSSQAVAADSGLVGDLGDGGGGDDGRPIVLKLPQYVGETAWLGIEPCENSAEDEDALRRQLRILGAYFHEHMLRLNGHQSQHQILLSARELDCLKWTAEGKTAWEASVILGISERTVRFHLNAAREKLDCATTTQAVAKVIRNNMIEL